MSQPNSSKVVDAIPLFELEEIFFMHNDFKESLMNMDDVANNDAAETRVNAIDGKPSDSKPKKNAKSNKLKFINSFQIRTITEGYNSGRQYIIQANSDLESRSLVKQIRKLAKISRDNFLAKSQFLKAQARTEQPYLIIFSR